MIDITTKERIVDLIVRTITNNPDKSLREAITLAMSWLHDNGALVSGLIDDLHDLRAQAEQTFERECTASVTISTFTGHAVIEYWKNGKTEYVFGHGKTPRECIEDARRKVQEANNLRAREYADLCATLGITTDGRIIEQAA